MVCLWVMQLELAVRTSVTKLKLHTAPARRWTTRRLVVPALGPGALKGDPQVALGWVAAGTGRGGCCTAWLGSSAVLAAAVLLCPALGWTGAAVSMGTVRSAASVALRAQQAQQAQRLLQAAPQGMP